MLRHRCPVCLSVCLSVTLVYCGHMVGRIKIPLGTEVGLGPGDDVFGKGHSTLPTFRPMTIVAKRSPISATAELFFCCCAVLFTLFTQRSRGFRLLHSDYTEHSLPLCWYSRPTVTSSSATRRETARRTSYFDSQNSEVEFLSHPFGGLGKRRCFMCTSLHEAWPTSYR